MSREMISEWKSSKKEEMHCLHRIYWGNRSACCHPNRPFLPLPPPALVLRCHAPRSFLSSLPVSLSFSSQEKPIIFLLVPNAYKSVTVAPTLVHSTKWLCRPVSDIYFFDCPDVVRNAGEPTAKCGSIRRSALGVPEPVRALQKHGCAMGESLEPNETKGFHCPGLCDWTILNLIAQHYSEIFQNV